MINKYYVTKNFIAPAEGTDTLKHSKDSFFYCGELICRWSDVEKYLKFKGQSDQTTYQNIITRLELINNRSLKLCEKLDKQQKEINNLKEYNNANNKK